jgi:uncharacterized membrane protein
MHIKTFAITTIFYFQFCLVIIFAIVLLLGGFTLPLFHKNIPFHSVDVFGILILISIAINKYVLNVPSNYIEKSISSLVYKISKPPTLKLGVAISIMIIIFFILHSLKHLSFHTHFYDVAFIQQPLFHAFDNPFLKCDVCLKNSYLAEHNSFTFFLLAPITTLLNSNYLIFMIECLVIAFPIYLLIKHGPLKEKNHLFIFSLLIILSSRALRQSLTWDFREDHLSFMFLTFTILCWHQKRIMFFFLSAILAMGCKENVAFITLGIGAACSLESYLNNNIKQIKYGIILSIISIIYVLFLFKIFIPFMLGDQQKEQVLLMRFGQYGKTPIEIIKNIFITPAYWWDLIRNHLFTPDRIKYIFILTFPFLLIGLHSFVWLIPISMGLAMNLLHEQSTQRMMMFHYDLIILPFLFYMALDGLNRNALNSKRVIIGIALAFALSGKWPSFYLREYWPNVAQFKNALWLSTVVTSKPIASNLILAPHIIHNTNFRVFGEFKYQSIEDFKKLTSRSQHTLEDAEYFLINTLNKTDNDIYNVLQTQKTEIMSKSPDNSILFIKRVL